MLFQDILTELEKDYEIAASRVLNPMQIYSVEAACGQAVWEEDVLYVFEGLCIPPNGVLPRSLVWVGPEPEHLQEYSVNRIQIRDAEGEAVFNRISELLLNNYRMQNFQMRMMDMLLHGKGLNGVLDEMGKTLNTAIVVMDLTGKILSYSRPFTLTDALWAESISQGYCPDFFMEHLREIRGKSAVENDRIPVLHYCIDRHLYYLSQRLFLSGELYGYAFMLQNTENFHPACREVLSYIGQAIVEYVLRHQTIDDIRSGLVDDLLIDMFNGISADQIRSRMLAGGVVFPERMCLVAVKPRYFHGDNYVRETLRIRLKQMFPGVWFVYYRKAVVGLFGLNTEMPELLAETKSQLAELCAQEHLEAGISNPYTKANSTRHYYNQAVKAMELAARLDLAGDLHEYRDLAVYDLIDQAAGQQKITFFCHPALSILREYDTANGSQLYDTLKAYVDNGFNQNLTAAALFLHRNTLAYRRQKIVGLTGVDLEDAQTQFLLRFSFLIENYIEKTRIT